jgi:hypothetical protein
VHSSPIIDNYIIFFPKDFGYVMESSEDDIQHLEYIPWVPKTPNHVVSITRITEDNLTRNILARSSFTESYVSCIKIIPKIADNDETQQLLKYEFIKHDGTVTIADCKAEATRVVYRDRDTSPSQSYRDRDTSPKDIYVEMYDRSKWELDLLILEAATLTLNAELIGSQNEIDAPSLTGTDLGGIHEAADSRFVGLYPPCRPQNVTKHNAQLITTPLSLEEKTKMEPVPLSYLAYSNIEKQDRNKDISALEEIERPAINFTDYINDS